MSLLVLGDTEVEALLPMEECVELMAQALGDLARGEAQQPLRMVVRPEGASGLLALMPAYLGGASPVFGLKAIGVFPGNTARGLDAHQGGVLLLDGGTGEALALMNASALTAIRTAAVSGVATRLLAREDAGDVAILGAGVQAASHVAALACVRPVRRARVACRSLDRARAFATAMERRHGLRVEAMERPEAAVRGADVIVTATSSAEPVLRREWLAAGAHVNAVGACLPTTREVDTATMAAARLFVDRRESALAEAGDYLIPLREGAIGPDHIQAELGEVLIGSHWGRTSAEEITLFESLGLAVEDAAAARHVYEKARERGLGSRVPF